MYIIWKWVQKSMQNTVRNNNLETIKGGSSLATPLFGEIIQFS